MALGSADIGVHRRVRRTFMFTDIVRSTQLIEALEDKALGDEARSDRLAWHDQERGELPAAGASTFPHGWAPARE